MSFFVFLSALLLVTSSLWAEGAAAPAAAGAPSLGILGLAPWLAIFAIFYFLLIRPQQKQAKEHQKMLDALKRGDKVLTQGGIYGTIQAVKGKDLEVKISDDVKVLMTRAGISQVIKAELAQSVAATPVPNGNPVKK